MPPDPTDDLLPIERPTPLQEFADAVDSPDYNPDDPDAIRAWRDAKYADRNARLYRQLVDEMTREIDRDIIDALRIWRTDDR